ncbi:hypothetical protein ACH4Q7_22445 [Streptomyces roseolus]|uniref:hypothetical protein n=1 Tax=Streptomyces roseolus TaxID=67358 RepID=UPI0037B9F92E
MNPDYLPELQESLRTLGEFAARHEATDESLARLADELDRARSLTAAARGQARANRCHRHPGCPVDPTSENGCLLCGVNERRPAARPAPGLSLAEVLAYVQAHGHEAATEQYGGIAVARAINADRHPSNFRPAIPAGPDNPTTEGHDQP